MDISGEGCFEELIVEEGFGVAYLRKLVGVIGDEWARVGGGVRGRSGGMLF